MHAIVYILAEVLGPTEYKISENHSRMVRVLRVERREEPPQGLWMCEAGDMGGNIGKKKCSQFPLEVALI